MGFAYLQQYLQKFRCNITKYTMLLNYSYTTDYYLVISISIPNIPTYPFRISHIPYRHLSCIFTISRPLLFISDITNMYNQQHPPHLSSLPRCIHYLEPAKHFISCTSCLPYFLGRLSSSIQSSVLSTSPPTRVGGPLAPRCKL